MEYKTIIATYIQNHFNSYKKRERNAYENIFSNVDFLQLQPKKRQKLEKTHHLGSLPNAALFVLFQYFNQVELLKIGRTCKHWYQMSRSSILWRKLDFKGFCVKTLSDVVNMLSDVFREKSPVQALFLPRNCTKLNVKEFKRLKMISTNLRQLELPVTNSMTHSISNAVLRELSGISSLERINLATHNQITDEGLLALSEGCPKLTHVVVDHCKNITPTAVLKFMKKCKRLRSFSALFCASCIIDSKHLEEMANHCQYLEHLALELGEIQPDSMNLFSLKAVRLKSLHIRGWSLIRGDALTRMCKNLDKLERLNIICDETAKITTPQIVSNSLQEFSLSRCDSLKWPTIKCPNLKKLHLESIQSIYEINLLDTPKLRDLHFRSCKLENINVGNLVAKLPSLTGLELFDCTGIQNVEIHSNSLSEISLFMCSDLENLSMDCKKLKSMTVDVCMQLEKSYIECPELEESQWFCLPQLQFPVLSTFYLSSDKLSSLSLQRCVNLKDVKLNCKQLTALNMADCKILETLHLDCPSLRKLALSGPKVNFSPDYVDQLARNCPKVYMLSLANIPNLSDTSIEKICTSWNNLQALIISNCEALQSPTIEAPNLKGLQLCDCPNLEEPVLKCSSLSKLYFRNGPKLKDSALTKLKDNAPKLKYLEIFNCGSIKSPRIELKELINLTFNHCASIKEPYISSPFLRKLIFVECEMLTNIQCGPLPNLMELIFQACKNITDGATESIVSNAPNLQACIFSHCDALEEPKLRFNNLKLVQFSDCSKLKKPLIESLSLQNCSFKKCQNLNFTNLNEIVTTPQDLRPPEGFMQMMMALRLPIPPPKNDVFKQQSCQPLTFLEFVQCDGLRDITVTEDTTRLNLVSCRALERARFKCPSLAKAIIGSCPNLQVIQMIGSSATELYLKECNKLSSIATRGIMSIHIMNCKNVDDKTVEQILALENDSVLSTLVMQNCGIVNPSIRHNKLSRLKLNKCQFLQDLHLECPLITSLEISDSPNLSLQFILKLNLLSNLEHVTHLILRGTRLTQTALEKLLCRLQRLRYLDISNTSIPSQNRKEIMAKLRRDCATLMELG